MSNNLSKLFENISRQCSCPVSIANSNYDFGYGLYYNQRSYGYACQIEIKTVGNVAENVAVLLHEKVHSEHENNECKCMQQHDRTLSEYHAFKESLQAALKLDSVDAVKESMKIVRYALEHNVYPNPHTKAAKRIIRLKLWKKALEYIA